MKIEWDENKNRINIKKHGFDFSDAERVFRGDLPFLYHLDTREDYGEDRWIGIGVLDGVFVGSALSLCERRAQMSAKSIKKQSLTDWDRIKSMQDEDIDFSDAPELDDEFFAKAVPWPAHKKQITLRLDQEVLDFFKAQGRGYQTAINNVLVRYVDAQQEKPVEDQKAKSRSGGVKAGKR